MIGQSFSLLFYLKKPKGFTTGEVPIYLRITVDGAAWASVWQKKKWKGMPYHRKNCRL
jgi:predicted small integral membrane protein